MGNVNLNPGGLIGALVCGGIAAAVVFTTVDLNSAGRGVYKLPILALIGGAVGGNLLWAAVFKKDE